MNQKFGALVDDRATVFVAVRIRGDSCGGEWELAALRECSCCGLLISCGGKHSRDWVVVVAGGLETTNKSEGDCTATSTHDYTATNQQIRVLQYDKQTRQINPTA